LAAGNFEDIYSGNEEKGVWAGVVTCFFIDCVCPLPLSVSSVLSTSFVYVPSGSSRLIVGEERPAISTNHL